MANTNHLILQRPSEIKATLSFAKRWSTSAGIWGASFVPSVTPLVRREVLEKTPVLGRYYQDTTPPSDKPF
ncbi:hypothetical protein BJ912DRAFT_945880 [Pholiota molesta]|nr:hypothetical protein BJ912DRAFT_945880 [Pholiota molesta]